MCSTDPFQFMWLRGYNHSSCYYDHQIGGINLTHYHIFPWLCAWDVCYIIFCHLLHIHSEKTGILFSLLLCSLWWVQLVGYVLAPRLCSFVCTLHHIIIIIVQTFIWGHWIFKMPVRYILSSVWVRLRIFSQLSTAHYMAYVFSVYPFPLWWLREYTLCLIIIIKSEVWTIIHCLGLGHETMLCAVSLSIFLWIFNDMWKSLPNEYNHQHHVDRRIYASIK